MKVNACLRIRRAANVTVDAATRRGPPPRCWARESARQMPTVIPSSNGHKGKVESNRLKGLKEHTSIDVSVVQAQRKDIFFN